MGVTILLRNINESEIKNTGKNREIRVGLMQLKALSQEAREFLALLERFALPRAFTILSFFKAFSWWGSYVTFPRDVMEDLKPTLCL